MIFTRKGASARAQGALRLLGMATGRAYVGPRIVGLEITHHCNLQCGFCETHGRFMEKPVTETRPYVGGRRTMDLDTVRKLAASLNRIGIGWVELSGKGDPVVHPKLPDIVRILKDAGLSVSMFTNGTVPRADLGRTLVDCGLDRLNVSLNAGSREAYAKVANKDLWERALGFVNEVLALRRQAGSDKPAVRLSFVMCKDNVDDMDHMVGICADLAVEEAGFSIMGELPQILPIKLEPAEVERLLAGIPAWSARLDAKGVTHDLATLAVDLATRGKETGPQDNPIQRRVPCYEGWMHTVIGPDGVVNPCCYCGEEDLGNVTEQDFETIWRGARYEDFRRRALTMHKTGKPVCDECFTSCNRAHDNQRIHARLGPLARR
jgi:radical SAM protein with 4Fe4S-binding SPASM domain